MNTTLRIKLLAVLPLMAACSSTPRWDSHAGDTVRAALAAQVANPSAAGNADPVDGVDGRAARAAQEAYERSYKQPVHETGAAATMIGSK